MLHQNKDQFLLLNGLLNISIVQQKQFVDLHQKEAIFIFFNTEEFGSAVCAGTVPREVMKRHLRAIIEKIDKDESRIVTPYDA